jgi:hypothetical protein
MSAAFEAELALLRERTAAYLGDEQWLGVSLHETSRTLHERAFYPQHEPRRASSSYRTVHRRMVEDEDLPCRICGVRASTLHRPKLNPYRATQMETHHHTIEWAMANAVDLERFQQIVAALAQITPEKYGRMRQGQVVRDELGRVLARRFTRAEMLAWIDSDRDNLWVLCDVHHRHQWFGVHAITGPVWEAQRFLRQEVSAQARSRLPTGTG